MHTVTRQTAMKVTLIAAAAASAIGLALGAAIGVQLAERPAASDEPTQQAAHDDTIDELSELNAALAQLEPRLTQLSTHVGELRDLQGKLKVPKVASDKRRATPAPDEAHGSGGPSLPPRPCVNASAPSEVDTMRDDIQCITDTLSMLEDEAEAHATAWGAFPGRAPVEGAALGSPFGNRLDPFHRHLNFHSGLDLVAATGTPILATAGGRVSFAGVKPGYGKVIEIDHGNGLMTRYGHASRLVVRAGDTVSPRQHVADVGSTGRSTGPHLHFEILKNAAPIDPTPYLDLFASVPDVQEDSA